MIKIISKKRQHILSYFNKILLVALTTSLFVFPMQNIARVMPAPIGIEAIVISPDNASISFFRNGIKKMEQGFLVNSQFRRIDFQTGKLIKQSTIDLTQYETLSSLGGTPDGRKFLVLANQGEKMLLIHLLCLSTIKMEK